MKILRLHFLILIWLLCSGFGDADYARSLKRAQYLLNGSFPTDAQFQAHSANNQTYKQAVRAFLNDPKFYDASLRYHERLFGVGLSEMYLQELQRSDIDGKTLKFARLSCSKENNGPLSCRWNNAGSGKKEGQCLKSQEEPVLPFWNPKSVMWVCPSVARSCGSDLSKCFIEYENANEAKNTELGTSEAFDSRFTILRSLSKQPAGIATAVAVENYPYTLILEPGITAVDGAIAHFYKQSHHFAIDNLNLPPDLLKQVENVKITDTRFQLAYTGSSSQFAGVLSTFGFLRRFEANRTRANQVYERLLCRKFTSQLPTVFPQDPGDLRSNPSCKGCHATLDPLADFFASWGEGGTLYRGLRSTRTASFAGKNGHSLADLSRIISSDDAFATCTVQNVWKWLVGREFYKQEEDLRDAFTNYFKETRYSFKELVFAVATHPTFTSSQRGDATVTDPLEQPPLGKVPEPSANRECKPNVSFTADIQPNISRCTSCHTSGGGRQPLQTEAQWKTWGPQSVGMMASGHMPPGLSGPPSSGPIYELKEAVRCWLEQNP